MRSPPAPPAADDRRVQIVVALIGLAGVLGAAVFANWDKLHPGEGASAHAAPSASATPASSSGEQHSLVSGVQGDVTIQIATAQHATAAAPSIDGRWVTPEMANPYAADERYRLQFDFQQQGDALHGSVTVLVAGPSERRVTRPIVEGRVTGGRIAFATRVDSTAGAHTLRYWGEAGGQEIALSRANDSVGGGETERFVARRP